MSLSRVRLTVLSASAVALALTTSSSPIAGLRLSSPQAFGAPDDNPNARPAESQILADPSTTAFFAECAEWIRDPRVIDFFHAAVASRRKSNGWPPRGRLERATKGQLVERCVLGWKTPGTRGEDGGLVAFGSATAESREQEVRCSYTFGRLVVEFTMASAAAQNPSVDADRGSPIAPAVLSELRASKALVAALEIVEADGLTVALEAGTVRPIEGVAGAYEARFALTSRAPRGRRQVGPALAQAALAAVVEPGKPPFVYFDGDNAAAPQASGPASGSGPEVEGIFCKWGSWTQTGKTDCRPRWVCGKKSNRQATFLEQRRDCVSNGVLKKSQWRWALGSCGC